MVDPFIGMVQAFGFNWPPLNWATCQGQYLSIQQYQALFALIGSQFGGDWRTVMAMPDLRGRVNMGQGIPVGGGTYDYDWGQFGGTESVLVHHAYLAAHTHGASFNGVGSAVAVHASQTVGSKPVAEAGDFFGSGPAFGAAAPSFVPSGSEGTTVEIGGVSGGGVGAGVVTLAEEGQQGYLPNMMPSQVVNWCIALDGEFPARN